MEESPPKDVETDPRFPSGPWVGFFTQPIIPGRHAMELHLTFSNGKMTGGGRDWVGNFIVKGSYSLEDGKCHWTKRYLGKHDVFYQGFNEGKGIWGKWEIPSEWTGGFYIWPEGMPDPTQNTLEEEVDLPLAVEEAKEELISAGGLRETSNHE